MINVGFLPGTIKLVFSVLFRLQLRSFCGRFEVFQPVTAVQQTSRNTNMQINKFLHKVTNHTWKNFEIQFNVKSIESFREEKLLKCKIDIDKEIKGCPDKCLAQTQPLQMN